MKLNSFKDLFVCLLSDIYMVEKQLVVDLPRMIQKAYSEDLKDSLSKHLVETEEQVRRLETIFRLLNTSPRPFEWARDLTNLFIDTEQFLESNPTSALTDAAIILIAQRIEHFEIATYGTLKEFADLLDLDEIEDILKDTLKEESKADSLLTRLAKGKFFSTGINEEAAEQTGSKPS